MPKKKRMHNTDNLKPDPDLVECKSSLVLVDTASLIKTFENMHCCDEDNCEIKIYEQPKYRQGHMKALSVKCNTCHAHVYMNEGDQKVPSFREGKLANRRFTFAADCSGIDKSALEMLCEILDIGAPPDSYYEVHQDEIKTYLQSKINNKMKENRDASKALHPVNGKGKSIIPVKTDGTYQKRGDRRRGYTSKVGVIILLDAVTNKFIDFRILNKYCTQCTQKKKVLSPEDFESWFEDHECDTTFEGASTEMERQAVKEMYEESKKHDMQYQYLVGDGDSKSFLDIWDMYGVCADCTKYAHILTKRNPAEFDEWVKTDEYKKCAQDHEDLYHCNAVRKMDCGQHVGKCFRDKLEEVAKTKGEKAPDGKSFNRGPHRLGPATRVQLQKYFTKAVRENSQPGILSAEEMKAATTNMRRAILASLYHSVMLDDDEVRHSYCPEKSWCRHKRGLEVETKSTHIDKCFLDILLPIYEYYTHEAMLQKLVPGMNTNLLESFNSVLWSLIPKTKYHGSKRTLIAVVLAIFYYEDGKSSILSMLDELQIHSEEANCKFTRRDERRKKQKEKRNSAKNEVFLSRLKEALQGVPDDEKPSYGPGIYGATAGPSSHMATTPFVQITPNRVEVLPKTNQFVAVPCGPEWYIAKVFDVDAVNKLMKVEFMYTQDHKYFYFKFESDASYEGLVWEPVSNILCFLPEPAVVEGRRSRKFKTDSTMSIDCNNADRLSPVFAEFPQNCLDEAATKFREYRAKQNKRFGK